MINVVLLHHYPMLSYPWFGAIATLSSYKWPQAYFGRKWAMIKICKLCNEAKYEGAGLKLFSLVVFLCSTNNIPHISVES